MNRSEKTNLKDNVENPHNDIQGNIIINLLYKHQKWFLII